MSNVRVQSGTGAAVGEDRRRLWIGVRCISGCRSVTAALVSTSGHGIAASTQIVAVQSADCSDALAASYARVAAGTPQSAGEVGWLATAIAEFTAELVGKLLAPFSAIADDVLAIGVYEPGLWHVGRQTRSAFTALFDPAVLAEQTGLPVIDAFAAGDLAAGGQGGPLLAIPLWVLLADPRKSRLLLDLGRTARLTLLPSIERGPAGLLSFDVGPGMILPDTLAEQFSYGVQRYDPGGTMAVQGRCIGSLIDLWLADPYFQRPPPRWYPLGVRPDEELHKTVHMAVEEGWTVRDLLCTATHFIAESVARAVGTWLPVKPPVGEILLSGGGARNGFLLAEIARRLPAIPQRHATDDSTGGDTLEAAAAAVLALMFVDQVLGNLPSVTGAGSSKVLGRLTVGSRAHADRLFDAIVRRGDALPRLRNAV